MGKIIVMTAAAWALAACSSTMQGVKADAANNYENTTQAAEKGWEKVKYETGKAVEKTGEAIDRVGEAIQR